MPTNTNYGENYHHQRYDEDDFARIEAGADAVRMDAGEVAFFSRQLDYIKTRTYDRLYPGLSGLRIVPVSNDVPIYAESFTYRSWDVIGLAKIIANYAQDLPRVDIKGREYSARVRALGASYGYNMQEIRASQALNLNLDGRRAEAARRSIETKLNQIALNGDARYGLLGLLNHPNVGQTVVTGNWKTATSDQILADLNAMYNAVITQSYNIHQPNVLVLPPQIRTILFQRYIGANADRSIGRYFLDQMNAGLGGTVNGNFSIESAVELSAAYSPSGTNMALMYERDENNLTLEIPERFTQWPAQQRVLEWIVPCTARCAGVIIYYPLALTSAVGL